MIKKTAAWLLILATTVMLAACVPQESATPPEATPDEQVSVYGLSKYTIVYPERYTEYQMDIVYFLRDAIRKVTGVEIPIIPDSQPYRNNEIILASSKRVTAIEWQIVSLKNSMEYVIAMSEGDVILGGGSYYGDLRAVYDFVNNYIGYDDITQKVGLSTKHIQGFAKYMYYQPTFSINAVGYQSAPFTSAAQIKALKDAGFNAITVDCSSYSEEQMHNFTALCVRYDIEVILRGVLYTDIYKNCPVILGHCIVDEPYGEAAYKFYSDLCDDYLAAYSQYGWKPYVNFIGQLDVMKFLADNSQYFSDIEVLSFCGGFFGATNVNSNDIFLEYETFAQKASVENKRLWGYVQASNIAPENTLASFRWMANVALCFGAKGMQYFNYSAPYGEDAVNGLWDAAIATNESILSIADTYNMYDYIGTYVIGNDVPEYAELENPYLGFGHIIQDAEPVGEKLSFLTGCFIKQGYSDSYAFVITNTALPDDAYNSEEEHTLRVKLDGYRVTCCIDGENHALTPDESGYYEISLKNSQFAFVILS